jgi:uncharacterized DUF497 family protein
LRFDWDDRKNAINLRKHGIDFETATLVFDDPLQLPLMDREVDGEQRWWTVGMAEDVLLLVVVHTVEDEDGDDLIRLISARTANAHERRHYEDDF